METPDKQADDKIETPEVIPESTQAVKFDVTDAAIQTLKDTCLILSIKDLDDKATYQTVYDNHVHVKKLSSGIEKKRIELNKPVWKDYQDKKALIDNEAKRIDGELSTIEKHLAAERKKFDDWKDVKKIADEKIKQDKIKARVVLLAAAGMMFNGVEYILSLTQIMPDDPESIIISFKEIEDFDDEKFQTILESAQVEFAAQQKKKIDEREELERQKQEIATKTAELEAKEINLNAQEEKLTDLKKEIVEAIQTPVESPGVKLWGNRTLSPGFDANQMSNASESLADIGRESARQTSPILGDSIPLSLTKENFWNDMTELYPVPVKAFGAWIDEYKNRVGWHELFNCDKILGPKYLPKYHDLPLAMQIGIFMQYAIESGDVIYVADSMSDLINQIVRFFKNRHAESK